MVPQEQKPLTLRRNFSWTFVGNLVYAACQWGMLVTMAKLGSPEMVGQFTLGLAITAPVIMFTNLQLRVVQATDAKRQYIFNDYLALRLVGTGLALLVIVVIILISGYRLETSLVILLVALAKAFESISDVFYGLIQQHERMDSIAVSMIIKGVLSVLLLSLGVYISGNVIWGVVGLVVAWATTFFCYDLNCGALVVKNSPLKQQLDNNSANSLNNVLRPRWQFITLKKLVWLALPLGFVMMLISLNSNIPRYFIERYLGERDLGIFAAIAYLMVAGYMVVSALGESASPRLAKYYADGNSTAFRTLLLKLVAISILLGIAGVLVASVAGKHILTILYRPEYAKQVDVFVLLMIVAAISYLSSFLGYGMSSARYFRIQMPLFIVVTTISAISCFLLIPTNGLRGAAMALLISAIIQAILSLVVVLHALRKLDRCIEGNYDIR